MSVFYIFNRIDRELAIALPRASKVYLGETEWLDFTKAARAVSPYTVKTDEQKRTFYRDAEVIQVKQENYLAVGL